MYHKDMISGGSGSAREHLLFLLKMHGPQTTAQLAKQLTVTTMAIRQHLTILEKENLVQSTDIRHKIGRPARLWQLTSKISKQFPDYHAELATGMIEAIRTTFGEDGLERLTKERTRKQIQNYNARMPDSNISIEERVNVLAQIRCEEGYMAEWKHTHDGHIKFVENHCSIANAACLCSNICSEELSLFRTILGDKVSIDRVEHILNGDRCCSYHIADQPDVV